MRRWPLVSVVLALVVGAIGLWWVTGSDSRHVGNLITTGFDAFDAPTDDVHRVNFFSRPFPDEGCPNGNEAHHDTGILRSAVDYRPEAEAAAQRLERDGWTVERTVSAGDPATEWRFVATRDEDRLAVSIDPAALEVGATTSPCIPFVNAPTPANSTPVDRFS